jgi:hypothetical protein
MPWGTKQSATQWTNITEERFFDEAPTLADEGLAHCQVTVVFPPNPKDDAIVRVYATLDDVAMDDADWDTQLYAEHLIEKVNDASARLSFTVSGVYRFRVGVQSAGTLARADFSFRLSRQPEQAGARQQAAGRQRPGNRRRAAA